MDNNGRTINNKEFRDAYLVTAESYLKKADIPPDMSMAKPLG